MASPATLAVRAAARQLLDGGGEPVGGHAGDDVDEHGAVRRAERAVVETAHEVVDQRRTRPVDGASSSAATGSGAVALAGVDLGARRRRGQLGLVLDQPARAGTAAP